MKKSLPKGAITEVVAGFHAMKKPTEGTGVLNKIAGSLKNGRKRQKTKRESRQRERIRQLEAEIANLREICTAMRDEMMRLNRRAIGLLSLLEKAKEEAEESAAERNEIVLATEFKTLFGQELDVEELVRTTFSLILAKIGPTNAAIFLPRDWFEEYRLAGYINCDCSRENILGFLSRLEEAVCPQMVDESEIVLFEDVDEFAKWANSESILPEGSQVIAFSCMHEERCWAIIVLFRQKSMPFDEKSSHIVNILRPIFAKQLKTVACTQHRGDASWSLESLDDDSDFGFEGESEEGD